MKKKWLNANVFYWSLFDFANSTFAVIVAAFVYQYYFIEIVAMRSPASDFYWAAGINISMLITAFLSPVLGASADYYHSKKKYLLFFTLLCVVTTGLMYFIHEGMILAGLVLFILANIGFQEGLGLYDTFIKEISREEDYNKVSSFGYAIGYLGSLAALAVVFIYKNEPGLSFIACAVLFLLFSLPLFLLVKENNNFISSYSPSEKEGKRNFIIIGLKRILDTLKHINKYYNLKIYLFAYFLYIDGINTIIYFTASFASGTFNFGIPELIMLFAIVQITALIGSFLFGFIADRFGTKKIIILNLIAWSCITILVFFTYSKELYIVICAFGGLFLGSAQSLSRSFMSKLIQEDEKKTEFFGFYSLFEKTSTILGPLTFGLVSWLSGSQRYAVLSLTLFFIAGLLLLRKVKSPPSRAETLSVPEGSTFSL